MVRGLLMDIVYYSRIMMIEYLKIVNTDRILNVPNTTSYQCVQHNLIMVHRVHAWKHHTTSQKYIYPGCVQWHIMIKHTHQKKKNLCSAEDTIKRIKRQTED